jgi:hypothetical protein
MKCWMLGVLLVLALDPMAATAQAQIFGAGPTNGTGLGGYPGPAIPGLYGNYGASGLYGGYGASGLYGGYGFPGNFYGPYDYYSAYGNHGGMGYGYSRYAYPRYSSSASRSATTNSVPHKYKNLFDHSSDNGSRGSGSHAGGQQKSLGRRSMNQAARTPQPARP